MDALLSPRRRTLLQATAAAAVLGACGGRTPPSANLLAFRGESMGSPYTVKLVAPGSTDAKLTLLRNAVDAALQGVVARMSAYEPDSELSRFNRHASTTPLPVSPDTVHVFALAQQVSEASGGAFDVTVAPVVDTWGFGPHKHRYVPAEDAQRVARDAIGHRRLAADVAAATITKRDPRVEADLSGIAKGYGVDVAACALETLGVERYMIEVGGEIRTRGLNGDERGWQIAIERPDATPQRPHFVVPLSGASIATSGDYRIFFEQDGRRYSHEMDPHSGAPVRHRLASVSVVADDCIRADAWSTALFVLGPERGLALARELGLAAYFIAREADGRLSDDATPAFAALGGRLVA